MDATNFEVAVTFFLLALMAVFGIASHFLYCKAIDLYTRYCAWYRYRGLKRRLQAMTKQAYTRRYK